MRFLTLEALLFKPRRLYLPFGNFDDIVKIIYPKSYSLRHYFHDILPHCIPFSYFDDIQVNYDCSDTFSYDYFTTHIFILISL